MLWSKKVYAEYQLREKSFWGYDVSVHNHAEEVAEPHKVHDSGKTLCAKERRVGVLLRPFSEGEQNIKFMLKARENYHILFGCLCSWWCSFEL